MSWAPQTFTALFPFCGLGAGARGFLDAEVQMLGRRARFHCLGGIDNQQEACDDFEYLTGSPALCADIATLTSTELLEFAGARRPDVIFGSPPCKGYSGLLSKKAARKEKYKALNRLVIQWIDLVLDTWADDLPPLILMENVPRIASRGKALLKRVRSRLHRAGYVFHEQTHDCGELGGLAQHRKRFLLVARHPGQCPPFLYQPRKKRVRGCGEVLEQLPVPLPGNTLGGPLHQLPRISAMNWVRLALIPAGGDWRDLPGVLEEGQDRREVHKRHEVADWEKPTGTVTGSGSNGVGALADPRPTRSPHAGSYGVLEWEKPSGTITSSEGVSTGKFSVGDPRVALSDRPGRHRNKYAVKDWEAPAGAVIGATRPGSGAPSVGDPRIAWHRGVLGIRAWDEASGCVTGRAGVSTGTFAVADIRPRTGYDHAYRVLGWDDPSFTVAGKTSPGCGAYQVADPRPGDGEHLTVAELLAVLGDNPKRPPADVPVIISRDGTWHRPLTTLELALLQGLPAEVNGAPLQLAGKSTSRWRERIGNAVPVQAAEAIARQMLVALSEAEAGAFSLQGTGTPVWVQQGMVVR